MRSTGHAATAEVPTYVDTSALLRLVEWRGDRSMIDRAMQDAPLSSTLAQLECWSALHRQCHDGEITVERRNERLQRAEQLLRLIDLVPIDEGVVERARDLTRRHPLRTLDGLHLATAVVSGRLLELRGHHVRFCTADRRQAQAAEQELGTARVDLVPPWR